MTFSAHRAVSGEFVRFVHDALNDDSWSLLGSRNGLDRARMDKLNGFLQKASSLSRKQRSHFGPSKQRLLCLLQRLLGVDDFVGSKLDVYDFFARRVSELLLAPEPSSPHGVSTPALTSKRKPAELQNDPLQKKQRKSDLEITLRDKLQCLICTGLMRKRIHQCVRGHLICGDCVHKVKCCPYCRSADLSGRNRALEELASSLITTCCYKKFGCNFSGNLQEMDLHEKTCACRPLACPFDGCDHRGTTAELTAHLLQCHNAMIGSTQIIQIEDNGIESKDAKYSPIVTEGPSGERMLTFAANCVKGGDLFIAIKCLAMLADPSPGGKYRSYEWATLTFTTIGDANEPGPCNWSSTISVPYLRDEDGDNTFSTYPASLYVPHVFLSAKIASIKVEHLGRDI